MAIAFFALSTPATAAGPLRAYLNDFDFNDYALSFEYYQSQSAYKGEDDFHIVYPIITSFEHSILTDDVYFVRDSYIGLRNVMDNGWKFGLVGKVQTLGYGANANPELAGMRRRSWSLQAGAVVGKRLGPIAVDLFASHDILNESGGYEGNFKFAWPLRDGRFSIVPQLDLTYQSSKLVNHYFGVRTDEVRPGRTEYTPGAAWTMRPSVSFSYRWHRYWYTRINISASILPDEIRDSPIVARDSTWAFNLGIAYDSRAFVSMDGAHWKQDNFFELSLGAFALRSGSRINLVSASPQTAGDLERVQRIEERSVVWPIEIAWQMGRFHRLDLRYFDLVRKGEATLDFPLTVGDITFPANELLATQLDTSMLRLGYSFSVFRDTQKELSILGGVSMTRVAYTVDGASDTIEAQTTMTLPVIGARGRASFTDRISLEARVEVFALDLDDKDGDMVDVAIYGTWTFSPQWVAGIGYQYFRQRISAKEDSLSGDVKIDYQGPQAFLRARF
jgi:outer membrane protein